MIHLHIGLLRRYVLLIFESLVIKILLYLQHPIKYWLSEWFSISVYLYMWKALITSLWVHKYINIKYFVNVIFETFLLTRMSRSVRTSYYQYAKFSGIS